MRITLCVLAVLVGVTGAFTAQEPAEPTLSITLERLPAPLTFHLSIRNVGESSALIVRPRTQTVDVYDSWGGWSLHVRGPKGGLHPVPSPGGMPPFTSNDLIELRPGESAGLAIKLGRFTLNNQSLLADLQGTYTVAARYHLGQNRVVLATGSANGDGFVPVPTLPPLTSNTVRLVVP